MKKRKFKITCGNITTRQLIELLERRDPETPLHIIWWNGKTEEDTTYGKALQEAKGVLSDELAMKGI